MNIAFVVVAMFFLVFIVAYAHFKLYPIDTAAIEAGPFYPIECNAYSKCRLVK